MAAPMAIPAANPMSAAIAVFPEFDGGGGA
jgi:hypothetical protein